MDSFESEKISFKSWDVMGLFEALKFMKLKGGSHGGENWRVSVFWVFLRVAQSRWLVGWKPNSNCSEQICHCSPAVCKAVQCEGSGRGINGTISVSRTETGWRGRQSFEPARNDTKWLPLGLRLGRAQTELGLFIHEMLRNHCYSALKYVISCGLHSKIGAAQKTFCLFSYTFFHYKAEKKGLKQREEF